MKEHDQVTLVGQIGTSGVQTGNTNTEHVHNAQVHISASYCVMMPHYPSSICVCIQIRLKTLNK